MKPEHKPEAKDRILPAAGWRFSAPGSEGTRVHEIADAAGGNNALIYYYFHNKEDILDSLIDSLMSGVYQTALEF